MDDIEEPEPHRFGADALDWMAQGLCTAAWTTEFFPDRGQRAAPAKAVCERCQVRQPCLRYALQHEIVDGIWGGLSAQERVVMIDASRKRARARRGVA